MTATASPDVLEIAPRERIVTHARVIAVIEDVKNEYVSGYGKDAIIRNVSLGWRVHFEGHWSMYGGATQPQIKAGDLVKITMEVA